MECLTGREVEERDTVVSMSNQIHDKSVALHEQLESIIERLEYSARGNCAVCCQEEGEPLKAPFGGIMATLHSSNSTMDDCQKLLEGLDEILVGVIGIDKVC